MGNTRNTGYLQNIVQYDASNNITLPANLTVTGTITGYATTSYVGTQLGGYVPSTRTISINGTSLDLSANRSFTINSMVYPGAGIAVSTGTAWGTSLTDNSSNWNTAYGWGNHAGLYSLLNHTHTFASLTSKPTTLVGYGITDAATSAQGTSADTAYGWGNHGIAGYLTGITSGQVTTALGFTPYNATNPSGYITTAALSTYATQSYVGTQIANLVASSPAALDTLNELAAALGNDAAFSTTVSTALGNRLRVDINTQGLSATLQGYGRTNLGLGTAATANTGDFAAASHTHSIANVTGLQTALDGKQASGSYAAATHSHIISDVTGLQTALDGKQASLGFTPYNSTNPSGYISSYTETDTLASVTGRGATTSTAITISNTLTVGSTLYANTGNEYLRNTAGAVNNAQFQTWFNSVGTRRGYFGYGSGGSNTLELNNESGGQVLINGGDFIANANYFRMKGSGGAEFVWYKDYSGSPSEPGFVINNRAGTTTFYHNANGGGTGVSGSFTAANLYTSNSLYLPDGGRIIVNNETDIWGVRFRTSASTTNLGTELKNIIYTGGGVNEGFAIKGSGYNAAFEVKNNGNTYVNGTLTAQGLITGNLSGNVTGTADKSGAVVGRSRGSFTVGGNTSTFYPVAFGIGSGSTDRQGIAIIQIERGGYDDPGYSNYTFSTFHCRIRAKADGWGYGASYVQVEANAYTTPMLADVSQQNQTSQLIVWLRGGCSYRWLDIEGEAGLNFGNPSGTSYTTFNGNAVYNSTTTNNIGSNFKYQTGWGDNFISGKLTASSASLGAITGNSGTLNVAYSIAVRGNLTGNEQNLFHVGNTGSGVNDGYMRLFRDGVVKVLIAADNSRGGDTYFNGGGNFGINTDVPSSKLEVFSGSTTADALTLSFTTGADNRSTGIFFKGGPYPYARIVGGTSSYGPDQGFIAFYTNYNPSGAASTSGYCLERVRINPNGSIVATGDITAFGSPSDARLKNIKEVIPNALTSILKLSGYRFDWKEVNHLTKIKEDMGVIAQEVEKVLPELARINDDGTMSVRYQGLTAVLIEAVKEQQTQIESQKSEIDELKDLVKQLINK